MKMRAFWDMASCSLITLTMEQYTPLKRRSAPTRLHGALSQKALFFVHKEKLFNLYRVCLILLVRSYQEWACHVECTEGR
jgi:hypothetical protein